jgi:D-alanine transaminase
LEALADLNGQQMPLADVKVSALDRGFLFGDAVYEVLRVYRGTPWLARDHWVRLRHSLASVHIEGIDLDRLWKRMENTIKAGPFQEALVYIQVTRGSAPRSHPFPSHAQPLELIYVQEFNDPYVEARRSGAAVITHPDIRWGRCDIKSTNLLANVLAMQAAKEAACVETLLYRPDGLFTEGSHSSLFWITEGALQTAPKSNAILPGITRDLVIKLAREGNISVRERGLPVSEIGLVEELFLSGTTAEVLPVVRVDGKTVGSGSPGPITVRLQRAYEAMVAASL